MRLTAACAVAMLLLAACAVAPARAQRSSCPSATCSSYFANAAGGPVDCCNHDFAANPRCSWNGTPVSFKQVRICEDAAVAYKVLTQSNHQGPPGSSECRCAAPYSNPAPSLSNVQMCVELKPRANMDIQGQDVSCNGAAFCKVCGGVDEVRKACLGQARCVAFTYDAASSCGYLKSGIDAAKGRSGWVAYTR